MKSPAKKLTWFKNNLAGYNNSPFIRIIWYVMYNVYVCTKFEINNIFLYSFLKNLPTLYYKETVIF